MPTIMRQNVAAGTANALDGLRFQDIPPGGALLTLAASTAVAGGTITLAAEGGDRTIVEAAEVNVEEAADRVNSESDLVLMEEPVGPGKLFLSTAAQVTNFGLYIEYT